MDSKFEDSFSSLTFEVIRVQSQYSLPKSVLTTSVFSLEQHAQFVGDLLVANLRAYVLGETAVKTVSFPADWLQAFKERWVPQRILRRFPVRYRTFESKRLFPNFPVPADSGEVDSFYFNWSTFIEATGEDN